MLAKTAFAIRSGTEKDLPRINDIVEACVLTWDIPERVKRLSMSSYLYTAIDLDHQTLLVAEDQASDITGVAAIETAESADLPSGTSGLLLHGLYVNPDFQRQGIARQLLDSVISRVKSEDLDGLLVKAQFDALGFFEAQGFSALPVKDAKRDYPYRLWLAA